MARVLREDYANIHRGVYDLSERATELHERRARDGAALHQCRDGARDRVHAQRHRGHQSGGAEFRRAARPTGRSGADHGPRAPRQHRALAAARRAHRAWSSRWRRSTTRASCCSMRFEDAAVRAHEAGLRHLGVERARHGQPGARHHRARPCARPAGAARRGPGGAAHAGRRARARLRVSGVLGAQAVRALGHRRAVRQGRAARSHAALSGRRRDDRVGVLRAHRVQRDPLQVRGRHAGDRGGGRSRRRRSTTSSRSASTASPRTKPRCWPTAPAACSRSPACAWSAPRATSAACCRSSWTARIRRTSARCWISTASRCAPAITARSRRSSGSATARPPALPSGCTTTRRTSTRWPRSLRRIASKF